MKKTRLATRLAFLLPLALQAHPDHTVTQKGVVDPVPSTQDAPVGAEVSITVAGGKRIITSNGLPDHPTGHFPNADNPNRISAQHYRFTVPVDPQPAPAPIPLERQPFGIAVNGVVFDPATAEAWKNDRNSGWSYDALGGAFSLGLDVSNGHVQRNGTYHYHGIPVALLSRLSGDEPRLTLLGWAADGYPIYGKWDLSDPKDATSEAVAVRSSYRLKSGQRPADGGQPGGTYDGVFIEDFEYIPGSGNLDACSGRFGITPEFPAGTYHYVLTEDFPFIPRFFHGTPDASFARRGPGTDGTRPAPPPRS